MNELLACTLRSVHSSICSYVACIRMCRLARSISKKGETTKNAVSRCESDARMVKETVTWRNEVKAVHDVLRHHQCTIRVVSMISMPDDIISIILQQLQRLMQREFIASFRKFLDGMGATLTGPHFVSVQTACARQNAVFMLMRCMCRYARATMWHMTRNERLLKSVTEKVDELWQLYTHRKSSQKIKARKHELSCISEKWNTAINCPSPLFSC